MHFSQNARVLAFNLEVWKEFLKRNSFQIQQPLFRCFCSVQENMQGGDLWKANCYQRTNMPWDFRKGCHILCPCPEGRKRLKKKYSELAGNIVISASQGEECCIPLPVTVILCLTASPHSLLSFFPLVLQSCVLAVTYWIDHLWVVKQGTDTVKSKSIISLASLEVLG